MPPSTKRKTPPQLVGLKTLSSLMGVSATTLRKLARDKILPQEPNGLYDLGKCIRVWIDWKLSEGTSPKRRIEEERAIKLKRENDLATGELVPMQEVKMWELEVCAVFRMAMESMPGRISAVTAMQEAAVVHEAVRIECSLCNQRIIDAITANIGELENLINTKGNAND
jgi:hypothetical protein